MNCAHCGVEINNEGILNKYNKWAFSKNGKHLCKDCGHELNTSFDLPIFLILLLISAFLLGSGLKSMPLAILGIVYMGFAILFGFGSTAFSRIKNWSKQVDKFYEVKR